jgi:predicted O-methyltransferase YrrM
MLKTIYRFFSSRYQTLFLDYRVDMKPRFGHGAGGAHPLLLDIVRQGNDDYRSRLESFLKYTENYLSIPHSSAVSNEHDPSWNNGFLPGLDIVSLYGMIREIRPKTYLEVGSGNSTKVVRKAITDGRLDTQIISIDPFPRASIDHLSNKIVRSPLEALTDFSDFDGLNEGDILFIDNSHRALPNSDVTVLFLEILPRLKKGVIVHVHDIYIPFDYPPFMCERAYSEQYVLAAFLLANPKHYKTILPNYYISETAELKNLLAPIWEVEKIVGPVERHGGSYWIKIEENQ